MIHVRCFHRLADAAPFRDAMNALNLGTPSPDPFSTYEFYDHFIRTAMMPRPGLRIWLLLAFRGEELVGYLALKETVSRVLGVRTTTLDLLASHVGDRPHLVAREADEGPVAEAIYAHLLERKHEWSMLEFQQQDDASALLSVPLAATTGTLRHLRWPNMASGAVAIRWASLAAYFATLSKKFRSNTSRQVRTLMASGDVEVLTSSDPRTTATLFELYRDVESRSWKGATESAFSRDARSLAYYEGLMHADQPMRIVIQILLLNGTPIAGLINGVYAKGVYALHIAYDRQHARLAPGSAILLMGLRLAILGGYETYHLLWGYDYYKSRWQARMTPTQGLQFYRVGSPLHIRRMLGDLKRSWIESPADDGSDDTGGVHHDTLAATSPPQDASSRPNPEQRARHARLIAEARRGSGEFLSGAALSAAMPFSTTRPAAASDDAPARRDGPDRAGSVDVPPTAVRPARGGGRVMRRPPHRDPLYAR